MFDAVLPAGSYTFSPYSLSLLATAIASVVLGLRVLIRERANGTAWWFAAMAFPIAWWLLGRAMSAAAPDAQMAMVWVKASYLAVPFLPTVVLHFSAVVTGLAERMRRLLTLCWSASAVFALAAVPCPFIVNGVWHYPWGWYPRYTPIGAMFIAFYATLAAFNLYIYRWVIRTTPPSRHRTRLTWFAIALGIGFLGGIDFFAAYGVPVVPLGHLAILATVIITGEAIRRHHLVDITPGLAATNIVSTMPDALLVCDDEWRIRIVNDALCRLLDYQQHELVGQPLGRIAADDQLARALAETARRDLASALAAKDGTVIPVSISFSSLDDHGRRAGIVVIARDMRERLRVEAELREKEVLLRTDEAKLKAEEHFRSLIENALDIILVIGDDGTISYASPSLRRVLGYSPRAVIGRSPFAMIHAEDAGEVIAAFERLRQEHGSGRIAFRVLHGDGSWRSLESVARAVPREGGGAEVIINCRDVTERRMAEVELRRSELQYRTLVESMREGIMQLDRNQIIRYVNDRACEMTGYSHDELIGSSIFDIVGEPLHETIEAKVELRQRGVADQYQIEFRRKDGELRWFEVTGSPWFDVQGHIAGSLGVLTDVTDRKRVEETLRRTETMSAMGALVGGVAHEVRNPLFAISSTVDAFEDTYGDREEYRPFVAVMRDQLTRLTELMSDLLELGRPAPSELRETPVDAVVEEAIALCADRAAAARVEIDYDAAPDVSIVSADRRRLLQAFRNLIDNAVQFSPAGGTVRVSTQRTFCADGYPWVLCTVADSGPGFPPADVPRLFDPFFSRRKGGTGLGLSIVRAVVEEHHGKIVVGNRPEGGAVIEVEFPVAEAS